MAIFGGRGEHYSSYHADWLFFTSSLTEMGITRIRLVNFCSPSKEAVQFSEKACLEGIPHHLERTDSRKKKKKS